MRTKLFFTSALLFFASVFLQASNQVEQKTLHYLEEVEYLSQKIATDYLFLLHRSDDIIRRNLLQKEISQLEEDLRNIAIHTTNSDVKNILEFLSYNKDQIKDLLDQEVNSQNASLLLDYSDTLIEGTESVLPNNKNTLLSQEQKRFLLYKIAKYYLATHLGIEEEENHTQLLQEITTFEHLIQRDNRLYTLWLSYKEILKERYFVPNILSILLADLDNTIGKNQR